LQGKKGERKKGGCLISPPYRKETQGGEREKGRTHSHFLYLERSPSPGRGKEKGKRRTISPTTFIYLPTGRKGVKRPTLEKRGTTSPTWVNNPQRGKKKDGRIRRKKGKGETATEKGGRHQREGGKGSPCLYRGGEFGGTCCNLLPKEMEEKGRRVPITREGNNPRERKGGFFYFVKAFFQKALWKNLTEKEAFPVFLRLGRRVWRGGEGEKKVQKSPQGEKERP